jgi:hypothetical protein
MEQRGRNGWQKIGSPEARDGKEGVSGSSPEEGSAKAPQRRAFRMCSVGAGRLEGLDGAVYGAFASRSLVSRASHRPLCAKERPSEVSWEGRAALRRALAANEGPT